MNFLRFDSKVLCIIILGAFCLLEFFILLLDFDEEDVGEVDLNNTTCRFSENIGRRIFLHICSKHNSNVYDIRHFFRGEDEPYLKPDRIGVQLSATEFCRICSICSNYATPPAC